MVIAITGSSGFVGRKIIKALKAEGFDIVEIDTSCGIDILNTFDLLKVKPFNVLVHLAAKSYVPDSYLNPYDFYNINVLGTLNMLELARKNAAKFIFISSYVYGPPVYLPIDEIHPLNPFNPYADSKIKGEELCKSYHSFFGMNTIIVRPFNIYGHGQNTNFLLPSIIEQAKKGVVTLKDARPKRDFIHIDDIVNALKLCVVKKLDGLEIFNLGSGISYSVKEVVEMVNLQFSDTLKINYTHELRSNEVLDTVANINHAKALLGWKPKINLEEGIKMTLHGV